MAGSSIWNPINNETVDIDAIKVVNIVADLQAVEKGTVKYVRILGYSSLTDSGGGLYWYDETDTTSVPGPFVVVATDGGRWKLASAGFPTSAQQGNSPEALNDLGVALGYTYAGTFRQGNGNKLNYYKLNISEDKAAQVSGVNNASGSKVDGLNVTHIFGGEEARGGRHAGDFVLLQGYGNGGPTSVDNEDRFYVGMQGQVLTDTGDTGSEARGYLGNYFGMSSYAGIYAGAAYINNVTGGEFNTDITVGAGALAGKRVRMHTGIQIASLINERGRDIDAALSVSNLGGTYGWKDGLAFHGGNGAPAFSADSTVIKVYPGGSRLNAVDRVIDVRGISSNFLLQSDLAALSDSGLNITKTAAFLALGAPNTGNIPVIMLRSGGAGAAFDTRLSSIGGTATLGDGILQIDASGIILGGTVTRPSIDNWATCGLSNFRWSLVFSAGGVQTTSDENYKTDISDISDAVLDAWETVEYKQYKMKSDVETSGEAAIDNFGIIAQQVIKSFQTKGLDALKYGIVKFDSWEASPEVLDAEGNVMQAEQKAGQIYSVNYAQANCLETALMRRELKRLRALLEAK